MSHDTPRIPESLTPTAIRRLLDHAAADIDACFERGESAAGAIGRFRDATNPANASAIGPDTRGATVLVAWLAGQRDRSLARYQAASLVAEAIGKLAAAVELLRLLDLLDSDAVVSFDRAGQTLHQLLAAACDAMPGKPPGIDLFAILTESGALVGCADVVRPAAGVRR